MKFSFKETTDFAKNFTRKESPKASKILDLLIDKSKRDYLNLCFTYLRWVDDKIDDPKTPINLKKNFIVHQKNLVSQLYENRILHPAAIEEACIIYFAEYAKSINKKILIDEVQNMVTALSMDVDRLEDSGLFSNHHLDCYIELMSKSLFNILYNFSLPESGYHENFYLGAKFTTIALMIRDLEEDIDAGFINIGTEDIEYYNLDLRNLKEDENLSLWLNARIKYILELLDDEIILFEQLPFKFKIFTYYSLVYRLPWIVRAKVYGYSLKYISDQNFFNEVKTYLITFSLSLKIFIKGFILKSGKAVFPKENNFISLMEALKTSEKYTRKCSFKLWVISHLLVPKKLSRYGYLCFNYLKWVDDFVDNPKNDKIKKKDFIQRQHSILNALSHKTKFNLIYKEEYFLHYFIEYSLSINNLSVISEVEKSLNSIQMDAVRICNDGILSSKELDEYLELVVQPVFNLTYYFLFPSSRLETNNRYIGRFVWKILILRDFFEDIESGYINISREDITEYNLDVKNLIVDTNRIKWMKDTYVEYLKILKEDINIFRSMPLKIKLFWSPIYPYMIYELIKIKEFNFTFGEKQKKSLSKEFKVIGTTILISIKFYSRVFFS